MRPFEATWRRATGSWYAVAPPGCSPRRAERRHRRRSDAIADARDRMVLDRRPGRWTVWLMRRSGRRRLVWDGFAGGDDAAGVREPRRPVPPGRGAGVALDLPDTG
jgi:hypothetical protein